MTTEILRNALFGSGLDGLGYIVLDECHYMGDEGRGTVWEEIIVGAPKDVLLVGLSATVANVRRSPTGSPSCTDRSCRSFIHSGRCRCTTPWPTSPATCTTSPTSGGAPRGSSATSRAGTTTA